MKKKKDPFKPLDSYEAELMKAIGKDEFEEVPNQEKEIKRLSSYFKELPKKDKRITIRVNENDLEQVKSRAVASGIPYQTIIAALIRQYAEGEISLKV